MSVADMAPPRKKPLSPVRYGGNPTGSMILKRLIVALVVSGLAPALGSCTQMSGVVADTWPHWAGGEPAGAPPRPGSPGYDEFINHGKAQSSAANPAANPAAVGDQTNSLPAGAPQAYAPQRPAPAAAGEPPTDAPVTRGGLY
jgi:hypothetical protein